MFNSYSNHRSPTKSIIPVEKRLRVYNQYPGSYANLAAMTEDLERIKKMNFKQVWVNPFYQTCKTNFITPYKINSPYAMKDHNAINSEYGDSLEEIQKYTARAKELGLIPLFDLVLNHVAIDHLLVTGSDPHFQSRGIDTKLWFKRHANGNLWIRYMDENHQAIKDNPWSDVATFDYTNPKIARQIIDHFWFHFVRKNIITLGFLGARLDATSIIPPFVNAEVLNFCNRLCKIYHGQEAYLLAETANKSCKSVVTHITNCVFWMPGPEGRDGASYDHWRDDSNYHAHYKGHLQKIAPSVGDSGSHDAQRYPDILREKGITDPVVLKQRMLEMILTSAFCSDGGHTLAYGDEFGVEQQINVHQRHIIDLSTEQQYDLSEEIGEINALIPLLPPPACPEWAQRVFYEKYPELVIFIIHQGTGFTGTSHVIIGNSYNDEDKNIIIDHAMLTEIMQANGRNHTLEQLKVPRQIFLCGKIKKGEDLTHEVIASPDVTPKIKLAM